MRCSPGKRSLLPEGHIRELVPEPGQRELVAGKTGSGKSAFMDWETITIAEMRPVAMQLIVDTKPRFRAAKERMRYNPRGRMKADYRYRTWAKGPVIPNSVVADLNHPRPFRGLFQPGEPVIIQSGDAKDWMRMLLLLEGFVKAQIQDRERRVVVDEALDFYQRNSFGIWSKHDVFYRIARAGRERNVGMSLGAQELGPLPNLIINMASVVTIFHLGSDSDMRYLHKHGIKADKSPEGNYLFDRYTVQPGGTMSEPMRGRCVYPESYLNQLSSAS